MKFRRLNADEIEVRIQQVSEKYCRLLLYKNARVDMQLLDETVGSLGWQRNHKEVDGKIYCAVSVWDSDKKEWISKEDVGVETNMEAEKGQASDSFKRACTNWGIGRELYTAPDIVLFEGAYTLKNGKCYDKFKVTKIGYSEAGTINALEIANLKLGKVVYTLGEPNVQKTAKVEETAPEQKNKKTPITPAHIGQIKRMCERNKMPEKVVALHYSRNSLEELTEEEYDDIWTYGGEIIKAYKAKTDAGQS